MTAVRDYETRVEFLICVLDTWEEFFTDLNYISKAKHLKEDTKETFF